MGNLRACFAVALLALGACGSDHKDTVDASIKIQDAPPPDMKIFEDAPPPSYDLSCLNGTPPTTATNPVSIGGTTQSFGQGGGAAVAGVAVDVFRGTNTTAVGTDTSDAAGAFDIAGIATGGTPITDGYIRAGLATYRTTYMYPPSAVTANLTGVPVIMTSNQAFAQIDAALGPQDDTMNGVLLFAAVDCSDLTGGGITSLPLIAEADATVEQNGTSVSVFNLGTAIPQLAGVFIGLNVPDGSADIKVSYNGMNFPTRTVAVHKKPNGNNAEGTLTFTAVRPGP
jgi:hypothetical protein